MLDFFIGAYEGRSTSLIVIELLAFVFGVWSVWLAKKAHIWVYPVGILGTTLTMYLFYVDRLLGDMMMNAYYSLMSIYGWWEWTRKNQGKRVRTVARMHSKEKQWTVVIGLITMAITYGVYRFTQTTLELSNIIDILTSGMFFCAMWLMARKKLENWTLWIIADLITIPLYAYRGWGMLSLQYVIFTLLAVQGYYSWKRLIDSEKAQ